MRLANVECNAIYDFSNRIDDLLIISSERKIIGSEWSMGLVPFSWPIIVVIAVLPIW